MTVRNFGEIDQDTVQEIILQNAEGTRVSLLTFGAIVRDFVIPLAGGEKRRVLLGYESLEGYRDNPPYMGVIAGRCCNRISGAPLALDGKDHRLSVNEGTSTHLHGGVVGFGRRNWELLTRNDTSALLQLTSDEGDEGYPGRVTVRCLYELCTPATLRITLEAETDAPTWVNLTSHPYFTLHGAADARDHVLEVFAEQYLPIDAALIPTGEIRAVAGTPYDFRTPRTLRSGGIDYDVNFVLTGNGTLNRAARVTGADGRLMLDVATTQPGLQIYDASGLRQTAPGLDGQAHHPYAGLAIETQHYPDTPHHPHFPSITLRPGEQMQEVTEYRFMELGVQQKPFLKKSQVRKDRSSLPQTPHQARQ